MWEHHECKLVIPDPLTAGGAETQGIVTLAEQLGDGQEGGVRLSPCIPSRLSPEGGPQDGGGGGGSDGGGVDAPGLPKHPLLPPYHPPEKCSPHTHSIRNTLDVPDGQFLSALGSYEFRNHLMFVFSYGLHLGSGPTFSAARVKSRRDFFSLGRAPILPHSVGLLVPFLIL